MVEGVPIKKGSIPQQPPPAYAEAIISQSTSSCVTANYCHDDHPQPQQSPLDSPPGLKFALLPLSFILTN